MARKKASNGRDHLSDEARALWNSVAHRCRSPGREAIAIVALQCWDRANEAAKVCDVEGLVTITESTGAVHVHPLLKVEVQNRSLFAKLWAQLNLNAWNPEIDSWGD